MWWNGIAVEEVIVINEETRGVGEEKCGRGRRMECSRGKGSASCASWVVSGDELRERTCWKLETSCLASLSVRPCLKPRPATSNSNL